MRWYIKLVKRQVRYVLALPIWALPIFVFAQMIMIAAVTLSADSKPWLFFLLSPIWIHTVPAFWLAGILFVEWMWMITGIYYLLGVQPHSIRRSFEPTL